MFVSFDDISVYNFKWKDNLGHLDIVLKTSHQHQLYACFSKCSFGITEIEYLGHVLSRKGEDMNHHKVLVV